jgi:hypothetical protein
VPDAKRTARWFARRSAHGARPTNGAREDQNG